MKNMKASPFLLRVFWVLFALAAAVILVITFLPGAGTILPFLCAAVLVLVIYKLCHWERIAEKYLLIILVVGVAVFLFFQYRNALINFYVPKTGDVEALYTGVKELLAEGKLGLSNAYFLRYPHQHFSLLELYAFNRIFIPFGMSAAEPYQAYALLSAAGIDVALVLFFFTLRRLAGTRTAAAVSFAALFFSPFCFAAYQAYSHVLVLPYFAAFLFFLVYGQKTEKRGRRYVFFALSGLFLGFSNIIAGETIIASIAVVIYLLLLVNWKKFFAWCATIFAGLLLAVLFFNIVWSMAGFIDTTDEYKERFPSTHGILMGLSPQGRYNEDVYQSTVAIDGRQEKQAYQTQQIKEKLAAMGAGGFLQHLWEKLKITWCWPPYFGSPFPALGSGQPFATALMGVFCLFSIVFSVGNIRKPVMDFNFFCCLTILGIFLFLLVWETWNIYYFVYLLLFIPPAVSGATLANKVIMQKGGRFWRRSSPARNDPKDPES